MRMRTIVYIYRHILALISCVMLVVGVARADDKPAPHAPDLTAIKQAVNDPSGKFYYPDLLHRFMSNDTLMDATQFEYFYYGTLFQEDYDPYRPAYDQEELKAIEPLYYQQTHTRAERNLMQKYAQAAIADNPLDLMQLKNLIFVYEQNGKVNLARIWKNKLNHLLETIAMSGTGLDKDNAWVVVYPRHEFDFLNITGITVQNTEFEQPYYEKVFVNKKTDKAPDAYYFNLQPILEQYYKKHPTEVPAE